MTNNNEEIDTLVRDFTSVVPRSKSEVRRRILELLSQQREEIAEKVKGLYLGGGFEGGNNFTEEDKRVRTNNFVVNRVLNLLSPQQ